MITLMERTPKKVSGYTSIFLASPYNKDVINILKSLDVAIYDKETRLWEFPVIDLAFVIDHIIYFDDVRLIIQEDNKNALEGKKRALNYKTKPFNYQLEGIEYGLNHNKWLLLDAPGLGKTLQTIYLAEELKAQRDIKHCLIICGINSIKANWKKEIAKHSNLDCIYLGEKISKRGKHSIGSVKDRAKHFLSPIKEFFIITNIETFRSNEVVDAFRNSVEPIDMIVVDEIHKCKSNQSQQGANLLKLDAPYKVAETGTLLLNSPLDSYVPLKWIGVEKSIFSIFRRQYCSYGGFNDVQLVGYKNLELLKDELSSCSLRRTQNLLELPPKNIYDEYIEMSDEHRSFYEAIKNGVREEADKVNLSKSNSVLALVTRLRQATSCPSILTSSNIVSSKLERCVSLTEQILSDPNEKVVIFSTFKEPTYVLQDMLKEFNPILLTGDTDENTISESIDDFQNKDTNRVIIATWQKMGTGFTLNKAHYMIFIDTPWTYGVYEQAIDRVYRIGTKSPVFIYNLICEDTIDERVSELIETKKEISDYVIDDIPSNTILDSLRTFIQEL